MNRIKVIDGYPCIEFPEGILCNYFDLLNTDRYSSIQNLKDLESRKDLMRELNEKVEKKE